MMKMRLIVFKNSGFRERENMKYDIEDEYVSKLFNFISYNIFI